MWQEITQSILTSSVSQWKDLAQAVQAAFTSLGILAGGIWTYRLFVRQRLGFPRAVLEIMSDVVNLPGGNTMLHATVRISNQGSVLLRSEEAELRLRKIVPLPEEVAAAVDHGYDPVPEGEAEVEWPMLAGRKWSWSSGDFEVEPGEVEFLHADFFFPDEVTAIEYYFFLRNSTKRPRKLGWPLIVIEQFKREEKPIMMMKDVETQPAGILAGDPADKEEKQQKPRPPQQPQQQPPPSPPPPQKG